jgi:hypothetical protein
MADNADRLLLEELERACEAARHVSDVPTRPVGALRRHEGQLEPFERPETDWTRFLPMLTRSSDFWERLMSATEEMRGDQNVEDAIGYVFDQGSRAKALWDSVLEPIVQLYGLRQPDWSWDRALADRVVGEWRQSCESGARYRTIAPLHNLRGMPEPVAIEDDLAIRPLTDEDRDALWRSFGRPHDPSPIAPSVDQLQRWTHAIDVRWPHRSPYSRLEADQTVEDVVRALRLHNVGITGTTVLWTHADPPDHATFWSPLGEMLTAPHEAVGQQYLRPPASQVGPDDAAPLRALLNALRTARNNKRLALVLRRFDAAYGRYDEADSLIDLWIAFEALLIPETDSAELSYRASLRIARLVGPDAEARRRAFGDARESYKTRSKVVHGTEVDSDKLRGTVANTRELAREVLRRWMLEPPPGGVNELDERMLV